MHTQRERERYSFVALTPRWGRPHPFDFSRCTEEKSDVRQYGKYGQHKFTHSDPSMKTSRQRRLGETMTVTYFLLLLVVVVVLVGLRENWSRTWTTTYERRGTGFKWEITAAIVNKSNNDTYPHDENGLDNSYQSKALQHHKKKQTKKKKYLLYFSQAGFANQMGCLRIAYTIAHALDRILLLPPILPHKNEQGSTKAVMVLNENWNDFPTPESLLKTNDYPRYDPFYYYMEQLPPNRYLPLGQVLDLDVTLPGIETIDV